MQSRTSIRCPILPLLWLAAAGLFPACAPHRAVEPALPGDVLVDGARQPAVSPDGRLLAVQVVLPGRPFRAEIYLFDGSEPRRLTQNQQFDGHPDWSPDGTRLAYTTGPEQLPVVRLMEPETGESRELITRSALQPRFAPDGEHLAFVRLTPEGSSLHGLRLSDGSVRELVPDSDWNHSPLYHPSGRLLLFVRGQGADTDVWAVDPATLRQAPILTEPHREQYPSLSPDGRWLVVASDRPLPDGTQRNGNSLWLVDLAGTAPRVVGPVAVPEEGYSYAESDFYPEGRRLAAARQTPEGRWQVVRVDLDLPRGAR